jgi:hypothetical protein
MTLTDHYRYDTIQSSSNLGQAEYRQANILSSIQDEMCSNLCHKTKYSEGGC